MVCSNRERNKQRQATDKAGQDEDGSTKMAKAITGYHGHTPSLATNGCSGRVHTKVVGTEKSSVKEMNGSSVTTLANCRPIPQENFPGWFFSAILAFQWLWGIHSHQGSDPGGERSDQARPHIVAQTRASRIFQDRGRANKGARKPLPKLNPVNQTPEAKIAPAPKNQRSRPWWPLLSVPMRTTVSR